MVVTSKLSASFVTVTVPVFPLSITLSTTVRMPILSNVVRIVKSWTIHTILRSSCFERITKLSSTGMCVLCIVGAEATIVALYARGLTVIGERIVGLNFVKVSAAFGTVMDWGFRTVGAKVAVAKCLELGVTVTFALTVIVGAYVVTVSDLVDGLTAMLSVVDTIGV